MDIMAITVWNPHAHFLVHGRGRELLSAGAGLKRFETRPWRTSHRGLLAIHAAKQHSWRPDTMPALEAITQDLLGCGIADLPGGGYIGLAELTTCIGTAALRPGPEELRVGNFAAGRYAWALGRVWTLRALQPARGRQGIWRLSGAEGLALLEGCGLTEPPVLQPVEIGA